MRAHGAVWGQHGEPKVQGTAWGARSLGTAWGTCSSGTAWGTCSSGDNLGSFQISFSGCLSLIIAVVTVCFIFFFERNSHNVALVDFVLTDTHLPLSSEI